MPCKTVREWGPTIVIEVQSLAILTLNLTLEVLEIPKSPGFSTGACWHVASQWSNTCDRRGDMAVPRDCGWYQGFIQFHTDT